MKKVYNLVTLSKDREPEAVQSICIKVHITSFSASLKHAKGHFTQHDIYCNTVASIESFFEKQSCSMDILWWSYKLF